MSKKNRIVITGLGTKNAIGSDVTQFAAALRQGICGISELDLFDTSEFLTHKGARLKILIPVDTFLKSFR